MNKIVNVLNGEYEPIRYSKNYVEQIILEKDNEIERLNKENKELKEQVVSAIRVNNICTENKSIIELQAQRYEQELTITKEKQLKEEIERLNNIINELEKYMKEERINNGQIDEWTIMEIQMKLQELKGDK